MPVVPVLAIMNISQADREIIETYREIIEGKIEEESERFISPEQKGGSGLKPYVIDLRHINSRILSSRTFAEKKSKVVINMSKLKSFILDTNTDNMNEKLSHE